MGMSESCREAEEGRPGRAQARRAAEGGPMSSPLPDDDPWARPEGVDDATVHATGTLGEGIERLERARGHLYAFHQLMGRADYLFGDAADELEEAGHSQLAELIRT